MAVVLGNIDPANWLFHITFRNVVFAGNAAEANQGYQRPVTAEAGALHMRMPSAPSLINFTDCKFLKNHAAVVNQADIQPAIIRGGAVVMYVEQTPRHVSNITFVRCSFI